MDTRLQLLTEWVRHIPGFNSASPEPVSGDASFRRYFRVWRATPGQPATPSIVMDGPPEHEHCGPVIGIAKHWHQHGVHGPAIAGEDHSPGARLRHDSRAP